jgi:DNA repair and recombination protein RAD52
MARVRVTALGVVRDGTGYGSGAMPDLGDAIESAMKEAETDAMKRALMTFGNPFGLALYDKDQANVVDAPANDAPAEKPASSASLKRDGAWEKTSERLNQELIDCKSVVSLDKLAADWRNDPDIKAWPAAWKYALKDLIETRRAELNANNIMAG